MFGIGFEELLLIIFIIFIISPKDIPKAMKKIGQFFAAINKIKEDLFNIKEDVEDVLKEDVEDVLKDAKEEIVKGTKIDKTVLTNEFSKKNLRKGKGVRTNTKKNPYFTSSRD